MKESFIVYCKDNLFLHYNMADGKYYFEGGLETASRFYSEESAKYFEQSHPEIKNGKQLCVTKTTSYEAEKINFN